ncbi:DNA polymerase III subunit alpha [Stenoxybacter acetivorans]|uniref:DNA polymerase III subunit alpha n=1 Tax=Stenoxybacter acetivorans TaxID=422441 RepID=UPI00056BC522|nr:DNA polymerase III subunit alpha [Stenoxybacter acetivorans]
MSDPIYIPLRLHTEFSIEDGMVRIDDAVSRAAQLAVPALGISDLMNTFGLVKFYQACRKAGIKPIMGADVWLENRVHEDKPFRLLLIAKNHAGYLRLNELLTDAYVAADKDPNHACLRQAWLENGDNSGLIALSGAHYGEIGQALLAGHEEQAQTALHKYRQWFGDGFYLELQRLPEKPDWETVVSGSLQLASQFTVPVVATHPTQFMHRDDFQAHEARVCIAGGWVLSDPKRPRTFTSSQYFITPDEMAARFADIPEALINSVEIAKRCNLTLTLGKNFLPVFPTPDGMDLNNYLTHLSNKGLAERMAVLYPDENERTKRLPEYQARLDFELKTIIQMGFPGYFLIVQDFINWAKQNGCPVGPGRGSGAGSLVAYALRITDLDPLRYALLFERFLNPERVSMPDFDIDFCQENRWQVIEYVRRKYGSAAVSQIVTFSTLSSKAVVRDVGRVLELPFGVCDRLSKLIPVEANKPLSLAKAMAAEPQIEQLLREEEAEELMVLAQKLEDLTRGLGMHAGGVLMAPGKITDFCAVYQAHGGDSSPVSMYDKDDVEKIGLVKFDFLGLRNLTIIEMAQRYIHTTRGDVVDAAHIPLDDAATYADIFAKGNTTAVFQFESAGMKKMLVQARPSQFEEIIAFVALYRPGPMDLIPDFIRRMHGETFEYLHPLLKTVLTPTYGVMVYQEQVMQAAQVCGGYTLGGADLLRRAMGKKKIEEMVMQRATFVAGASAQGINETKANEIFDYMEKFAGYGFNKSHAAAYALVAYQTAWLKRHYPAEFMAATMSSELDNTDQLKIFYEDAKANGITFLPPCVNHSDYRFTPCADKQIRYALGAIKGTGEGAAEAIAAARQAGGAFKDLFDFCERVGKQHINRRVLEALVRGGAFDAVEANRAMLLANIDLAINHADQAAANANQGGLFDFAADAIAPVEMVYAAPWTLSVTLAEEKQAIGFYLSGHPFAPYANEIRAFARLTLAELKPTQQKTKTWVAGFVTDVRYIAGKRGKFAVLLLEDGTEKTEVVVAGQLMEANAEQLKPDQILLLECKITADEYNGGEGLRITADSLYTLDAARERFARCLKLNLKPHHDAAALAALLNAHTQGEQGERHVPLKLFYSSEHAAGELRPAASWQVRISTELLASLSAQLGEYAVAVGW